MAENKPIDVAIIDDGVSQSEFNLAGSWEIAKNSIVSEKQNEQAKTGESHGTICAKIIRKYLKKELIDGLRFHSITVLDSETMQGNIDQLITAFELCLKLDTKVVHMSIGTSHYKDFPVIQKYAEEFFRKGVIIIAAVNNKGVLTYPACLPYVIGVKSDASLRDSQFRYFVKPFDGIDIAASSRHILRNGANKYITSIANSYAAPVVTSKVISYLAENPSLRLEDIQKKFMIDAMEVHSGYAHKPNKKITIPVILFEDFSFLELCPMMRELKQLFWQNEYNCKAALDGTQTELPDFEIIPDDPETYKYLCEFWDCDVLLVGLANNSTQNYFDEIAKL
jgi:hypothetical protein